jgi:hypothetical protein
VSPQDLVVALRARGLDLVLEDDGLIIEKDGGVVSEDRALLKALPAVRAQVVSILRAERESAILRLREIHRAMGFSEEDVLFIEEALLSGKVLELRIASTPPDGPVA